MAGVTFSKSAGKRILRGVLEVEGNPSVQDTPPPKNTRHPRRPNPAVVIEFAINDIYSAVGADATNDCTDQSGIGVDNLLADVTSRPCGLSVVPGEVNGQVSVYDRLGFFSNRSGSELQGKTGFAARMKPDDGQDECKWVIIWMDLFRTVQVVTDIIFGEAGITIERKNVVVWDDCDLPDENVEGTECALY